MYAAGPVSGFATFNVSARVGAPCAAARELSPELGPIDGAGVGEILAVAAGALAAAAALAWYFARRHRARYQEID